jgi:hypothetical protein
MCFEDFSFNKNTAVTKYILPALLIELLQEVRLMGGDLHSAGERHMVTEKDESTKIVIRSLFLSPSKPLSFLKDIVPKTQKIANFKRSFNIILFIT